MYETKTTEHSTTVCLCRVQAAVYTMVTKQYPCLFPCSCPKKWDSFHTTILAYNHCVIIMYYNCNISCDACDTFSSYKCYNSWVFGTCMCQRALLQVNRSCYFFRAGLQQDRMAFRINFPSLDHMVLRVARPNELSKWVEAFEKV